MVEEYELSEEERRHLIKVAKDIFEEAYEFGDSESEAEEVVLKALSKNFSAPYSELEEIVDVAKREIRDTSTYKRGHSILKRDDAWSKDIEDIPTPEITEEEMIEKCQANPWLKRGGAASWDDVLVELEYGSYGWQKCKTIEELKECLQQDVIRAGCIFKNLAFTNQVHGGDEWWTVKKFADGELIAFESITARPIIKSGEFEDLIERFMKATKQQCKDLTY